MILQIRTRLRLALRIALPIYVVALLVATHWPQPPFTGARHVDKYLHFSAYAVLALLVTLCLFWKRALGWRQLALIFLTLAIFGGLDELTQPPFNRTADWLDWCADLFGILIGLLAAMLASRYLSSKQNEPQSHNDAEELAANERE